MTIGQKGYDGAKNSMECLLYKYAQYIIFYIEKILHRNQINSVVIEVYSKPQLLNIYTKRILSIRKVKKNIKH